MTVKDNNSVQTGVPALESLLQACRPGQMERVAQLLETDPENFRVLRRFDPETVMLRPDQVPEGAGRFVIADTETTGKDPSKDRIIELGMVEVAYDRDVGYIYGVTRVFDELEDPGVPIPPEASAVNGITDDMVAGKEIDDALVEAFVQDADFILCHNSRYDRPLLERRFAMFAAKAFACSMTQVDWQKAGIGSSKLEFIATCMGFFFNAHRADADCLALVKVLNTELPKLDGASPLQGILETYRSEDRRIWATGAPFDAKDKLKERGYRWFDGSAPDTEKAWAKEVSLDDFSAELDWLKAECFYHRQISLPVDRIDALNRFTVRRDKLERAYR